MKVRSLLRSATSPAAAGNPRLTQGPAGLEKTTEQLDVLSQRPRAQERVADVLTGALAELLGSVAVREQVPQCRSERLEVKRVHQHAILAVEYLVLDASDPARHHRAALPHRFRNGQAEALREALLDHDRGVALKRVHDRGVLLGI